MMTDRPPELEITDAPEDFVVPTNWRTSKRHQGRVVLAGTGGFPSDFMMITSSVLDEDTTEVLLGVASGLSIKSAPALLKGPHGVALKDLCTAVGIAMSSDVYFTALCKWLLPQAKNLNPKPKDTLPGHACLDREIREVQPKVVATFGKAAFEFLVKTKVRFSDAIGMVFWSDEYQCQVVPMQHYYYVMAKQEWNERFALDLALAARLVAESRGVTVARVPQDYKVISCKNELADFTLARLREGVSLLSVDCEWHGRDHVDGELRSMQMSWAPGKAVYIRFRDESRKYVFDCSYREAGAVLAALWNQPQLKLVGHHISADLPWIHTKLGLEWYNKVVMDTEFAYQCVNEHGDRGLERMSMRYTDCGRYEYDLEVWKRDNKVDASDGYGYVPDSILIPYACADVDVPLRAYPIIRRQLEHQGMWGYYSSIMNPFVTNGFTQFSITGLPMNKRLLEEMREVYHFAKIEMEVDLAAAVHAESRNLVAEYVFVNLPSYQRSNKDEAIVQRGGSALKTVLEPTMGDYEVFLDLVYRMGVPRSAAFEEGLKTRWEHMVSSPSFNIRSPEMLKRWLFGAKGYQPIKSTANKEKGLPSTDWAKVMAMPEARRKGYNPAVDKQTLVILAEKHKDPLLMNLLQLNAVGNICKAFLSQPERDENGQITEEAGLIAWIASDGRVHGQFSMTETGRPRSWNPNSLNWPSGVQKRIVAGIERALKRAKDHNRLPEHLLPYLTGARKVLPLRACVQAPEGSCITESDFATAEIRALAFVSGDENLIDIVTGRDSQFALVKHGEDTVTVRLSYSPKSGIRFDHQDPKYLMAFWKDGQLVKQVTEADLLRNEDGSIRHPGYDLHWSLAEMVQAQPREALTKADRDGAKVGNFCLAKGQKVLTARGAVNIEDVLHCDLLWDGVEWVAHEGVIHTGRKIVRRYQGLWATDNHEVWTTEKGKVSFGQARTQRLTLQRVAAPSEKLETTQAGDFDACTRGGRQGAFLHRCEMSSLLKAKANRTAECGTGAVDKMPVLEQPSAGAQVPKCEPGSAEEPRWSLSGHAAEVQHEDTCVERALPRPRHKGDFQKLSAVCELGTQPLARRELSRKGFRPHRQRRALRARELAVGGSNDESFEPSVHASDKCDVRAQVLGEAPSSGVYRKDCAGLHAKRVQRCRHSEDSCGAPEAGREAEVYDILNVGPRHRFVCAGVLVSNSSMYGATAATLERKVEADTGVAPEPGTGEKLLKGLEERQPVATAFLNNLEEAPENPGYLRAASGKVRHFNLPSCSAGVPSKLYRSQKSAQGREARNFFMQESVAATAMRATNWMQDFARKYQLGGVPMTVLYDSVCTLSEAKERFVWAKAHAVCMHLANGWEYHGRVLRYPIETDLNSGWSLSPEKDPRYKHSPRVFKDPDPVTDEKLAALETWLDSLIDYFKRNERASLSFTGLA